MIRGRHIRIPKTFSSPLDAKNVLNASQLRSFSSAPNLLAKNRIFTSVRNLEEFNNHLLLSATNRTAYITLWTASWCASCKIVSPIIKDLIESEGIGEKNGGVSFAEVEIDSPDIGDLPLRYLINSTPTLLSFSRQEAQLETRLTNLDEMKDREFLRLWLEGEAGRGGSGGGGGGGLFGGMFGMGGR